MTRTIFRVDDKVKFHKFNYIVVGVTQYSDDKFDADVDLEGTMDDDAFRSGKRRAEDAMSVDELIRDIQRFAGTVNGKRLTKQNLARMWRRQ